MTIVLKLSKYDFYNATSFIHRIFQKFLLSCLPQNHSIDISNQDWSTQKITKASHQAYGQAGIQSDWYEKDRVLLVLSSHRHEDVHIMV